MKMSTKSIVAGSILSAGAAAAVAGYQIKKKKGKAEDMEFLEVTDMRNSKKVDIQESPDAEDVKEAQGLTKLDEAFRDEWQANGFPQTHAEQRELEKEEQNS
ncbi:hypothetical protein [Jeotgalibacillus proteolyticus]|uniref:Uncharacterized protein n=1 Tax=Jeotgalibacillus proteolyticus TaxID=2082395 RepID=A0A2S5GDC0_9BACL|nr:hypothetical protein [Jeotgalibacillus proteolyticus]PPA70989.1 hypothetical protein C4B60_09415 [Jeotgalibacillus proteolyticus]